MEKSIYSIQGYIPSDEKIAFVTIYKLCKIGKVKPNYIWVLITGEGGIGTSTDEICETPEDALIKLFGFQDEINKVLKCDFEKALEIYNETKDILNKRLLTNKI